LIDTASNWEQEIIQNQGIDIWVNDRLNTDRQHALNVKSTNIKLVTLDDRGSGAELANLNVAALVFDHLEQLRGDRVLTGAEYLILDQEINHFRRLRTQIKRMLVSMGGSDTYGVTVQVVQMLKKFSIPVTVITGPGFEHMERLQKVMPEHFDLRINVPSLIEAFFEFDLAFTAGGVTPFEACASGLPCIVIASEEFEIPVGEYLQQIGAGLFAGYYKLLKEVNVDESVDIKGMSRRAMLSVDTKGADRVYKEIMAL